MGSEIQDPAARQGPTLGELILYLKGWAGFPGEKIRKTHALRNFELCVYFWRLFRDLT